MSELWYVTCIMFPMGGSISNRSGTSRDRLCPRVKLAFRPQVNKQTLDTTVGRGDNGRNSKEI